MKVLVDDLVICRSASVAGVVDTVLVLLPGSRSGVTALATTAVLVTAVVWAAGIRTTTAIWSVAPGTRSPPSGR